jgi:hypothetical protein
MEVVLVHLRSLSLVVVEVQLQEVLEVQEVLVLEVVGVGAQVLSFLSLGEVAVGLEEFFY